MNQFTKKVEYVRSIEMWRTIWGQSKHKNYKKNQPGTATIYFASKLYLIIYLHAAGCACFVSIN